MLRSFTIADLGLINAYKNRALFLHNQAYFTEGQGLTRTALLSLAASVTGIFTAVCNRSDGSALIGQVRHHLDQPVAYCQFVAPESALDSPSLSELIDQLLTRVGKRGAHSLVAEVEEDSPAFAALRKAGFSIYARQRIWRVDKTPKALASPSQWRPVFERDELAVHLLHNRLLTGQVQQIETNNNGRLEGYVYYREGELLAFVEVKRGPLGIWAQPFVDLDAEPFDEIFLDLLGKLRPRASRPLYICVRSYQNWLEGALTDLNAQPGARQVALARRTVLPLKVEDARALPVAKPRAEPTVSIHAPIVERRREPEWMSYDQTPNYR